MDTFNQNHSNSTTWQRTAGLRWEVLFSDLSLLASLILARIIVWRVLRRQLRDRNKRLSQLQLIPGGNRNTTYENVLSKS